MPDHPPAGAPPDDADPPVHGTAPAKDGLLERSTELDQLGRAWEAARTGRGSAVIVSGEAGIGKSALVGAFVDGARAAPDVRVATGRCDALVTPRALGPFLDIAATLGLPAGGDRDALLATLVDDLRAGAPTVLVVEDAHWADDATVELVAMLGHRAADLPLLLVVTCREGEVTADHPLRNVLGDLASSGRARWLGVRPLSEEAVCTLAARHDVDGLDLHRRTGGNPFFVTEVLAAPTDDVPTTVRLAVLARAARLPPGARDAVDVVSVVPGAAETWLVDAIGSSADGDIAAAVRTGILLAGDRSYSFRHELARLAIEQDLPAGRRRELHRRALTALAGRPDTDPARLAHHAGAADDDGALGRYAAEACRLAADRGSYPEAVHHGEQALSVRHLFTANEQAELEATLGSACIADAQTDRAIELYEHAAAHWRANGDDRREAHVLTVLSSALVGAGRTTASLAAIERAAELLERHPAGDDLAATYVRLCSSHMLARDRDRAVSWGERAIALATELDADAILGRALIETGIADVMDERFDGLDRVHQGIELGRRHDLPQVVSGGYLQTGSGCGELRRYHEAVPALEAGIAHSAEHHLEYNRRYSVAWLGRCRFDLGQWDEAERHARDALRGSRSLAIARFVALTTLGWLRARRGDGDVWPLLDEALEIARRTDHLQRLWPVAVARAEAGELEGRPQPHGPLLDQVADLALRCRHRVAFGEIGVWLQRTGRELPGDVDRAAPPFAAWLAGDPLGAAAGFRSMGCPYEAALALADHGSTASLREALATFERLGAAPMASRVADGLRGRGVRIGPRRAGAAGAPHPAGLSSREVEVLRLVVAGFTNPQIAASLYISRRTAEHHVSSILVKLGVTSRVEAATAAVRLGLAQ